MKDSPESKYGDVTGIKPIALSLIGGIVSFCIIDFFIHSGDFRKTLIANIDITKIDLTTIPNPFQKNISKSVYVFEYANDPVMGKYGVVYLEPKCLDQTKSIRKNEFDELLSKGVKITSSIPRKTEVTVGNLYGECVGASYILEGPENLLNKL